jgi:DnaK suppressor protein
MSIVFVDGVLLFLREPMKKSATPQDPNAAYRELLVQKRKEVMSGLGTKFDTLAGMGRVAEDDQAQITHDEFVSLRMNSLDYLQLRLVEEALDRLDSGDYGICLACEEPIAPKRLRALSWARYCVSCQETVGADLDREWVATRATTASRQ